MSFTFPAVAAMRKLRTIGLAGLSFLPALLACSSNVPQDGPTGPEGWPRRWTADDVRRLRPELLDISRSACLVDNTATRKFLAIKVLERTDEVMDAIIETMDLYGFAPLPNRLWLPAGKKYTLPDDIYSCYYRWRGFGSTHMMLVQHYRCLPEDLRAFGPPRVWRRDVFHGMLRSRLSAHGLSRSVTTGEASLRDWPRHQNNDTSETDSAERSEHLRARLASNYGRCRCLLSRDGCD